MSVTAIYHITHVENLPRILETKGLWCDAQRVKQGFVSVGIAHEELKRRRAAHPVPVAAGGTLGDYVPFYFSNRSPMLYSIHGGRVAGYRGGQTEVVYLVSSVEQVAKGDRSWCFTDGHAVMGLSDFYDQISELDKVDWDLMKNWRWKDSADDPDRKRRKQAEFLVHRSLPWSWIEQVGVIDEAMAQKVRRIVSAAEHQPPVSIQRKWYYD